jgi:hypothetical protein
MGGLDVGDGLGDYVVLGYTMSFEGTARYYIVAMENFVHEATPCILDTCLPAGCSIF